MKMVIMTLVRNTERKKIMPGGLQGELNAVSVRDTGSLSADSGIDPRCPFRVPWIIFP